MGYAGEMCSQSRLGNLECDAESAPLLRHKHKCTPDWQLGQLNSPPDGNGSKWIESSSVRGTTSTRSRGSWDKLRANMGCGMLADAVDEELEEEKEDGAFV